MKKRPRAAREGSALALAQLWHLAQLDEERFNAVKILVRRVSHAHSMTSILSARRVLGR